MKGICEDNDTDTILHIISPNINRWSSFSFFIMRFFIYFLSNFAMFRKQLNKIIIFWGRKYKKKNCIACEINILISRIGSYRGVQIEHGCFAWNASIAMCGLRYWLSYSAICTVGHISLLLNFKLNSNELTSS